MSAASGTDSWGSPLLEIERAVQERAKALALDMARPAGKAALRALVDDEIQRWTTDVNRGVRRYALADPAGMPSGPGGTWAATGPWGRSWPTLGHRGGVASSVE